MPVVSLATAILNPATVRAAGYTAATTKSIAYTDDNDGNQFDQIILGTGVTNSTW